MAALVFLFIVNCLLLQRETLRSGGQLLLFLQNLGHQLIERYFCAFKGLGAGLNVNYPYLFSDFGGCIFCHLTILLQIYLVAHEQEVDARNIRLFTDFFDPKIDHFEAFTIRYVKHQQNPVHIAIVVRCDCVVASGAGSIPDLNADVAAIIELNDLLFVFNANGGGVVGRKLFIHVLREERTFSDIALSDNEQFNANLLLASTHPYNIQIGLKTFQKHKNIFQFLESPASLLMQQIINTILIQTEQNQFYGQEAITILVEEIEWKRLENMIRIIFQRKIYRNEFELINCQRIMNTIGKALNFGYKVVKRTNGSEGKPLPNMAMYYLNDYHGNQLSFWNDIPLGLHSNFVTCCIEIPKQKSAKFQVYKLEKNHPFMQDTKKNLFTGQRELRYYSQFPLFNYGFIPQTWEQNIVKDSLGLYGDDDPIDICDFSSAKKQLGSIFKAQVLGSFCLIDQGQVDWKIIVMDAEEAKRENIRDVSQVSQARLEAVKGWFKGIKLFEGKKANEIAYNQKIFSVDETLRIITETHEQWKKLITSDDASYSKIRKDYFLEDVKL